MVAMHVVDALESLLSAWVAERATASHPVGLANSCARTERLLLNLGFRVDRHAKAGSAPVLVASRSGQGGCIGLSAHYDVEEEGPGWSTPAFTLTQAHDRWFGRGVADNLGPLALRLCTLAERTGPSPSLLWVIQGEEEIGSQWAHELYPQLDLPHVDLWLEETGYFESNGRQRMLVRGNCAVVAPWIDQVVGTAAAYGRIVDRHDRFLNKAFGEARCPFLSHLVGTTAYLAIGPNDPQSRIHSPDESLSNEHLAVSIAQFDALLSAAAGGTGRPGGVE